MGISIIVCCYNSAKRLRKVLDYLSLLKSNNFDFEVIVVDNMSTDDTQDIATTFFLKSEIEGRVISEETPGLSNARRKGVFSARFPIVLFCDDDNLLIPDYLTRGIDHFRENDKLGCLGGYGIAKVSIDLPYWFDQFSSSYAVGALRKVNGIQPKGAIHYGAGLFFKTQALKNFYLRSINSPITDRKANLLSSGGDSELCLAIQLDGWELGFDNQLSFYHEIIEERISKDYYLKLREGILSNYPILTAYEFLLVSKKGNFAFYLVRQIPFLFLGLVKTYFALLKNGDFASKVYCCNYLFKVKYLLKNYSKAIALYKELKIKYSS